MIHNKTRGLPPPPTHILPLPPTHILPLPLPRCPAAIPRPCPAAPPRRHPPGAAAPPQCVELLLKHGARVDVHEHGTHECSDALRLACSANALRRIHLQSSSCCGPKRMAEV